MNDAQARPRVTVFTPSHRPQYLKLCLESLLNQTFQDWEWVVVLNQGARWNPKLDDRRVRIIEGVELRGVGAAKRFACGQAFGEILVELDHDDLLSHDALEELVAAFDANPEVGFVFSNCAQIKSDGSRDDSRFNELNGWTYQEVEVNGRPVLQCDSLEATPHNVSYIWFAPNHVRAFRKSAYDEVGGYDETRDVLDDQDLMCRLYSVTDFYRIDKCLYLQRVHDLNTQSVPEINARIQQETVALYDRYVTSNALAWSRRRGLRALQFGSTQNADSDFQEVEIDPDMSKGINLPDSSVGVIRAADFLVHIPDKIGIFNEIYRILAHGGMFLSITPSTDGRGAFQDPTHVAHYNENSFWYYVNQDYAKFVPEIRCRFQSSRTVTYFPTPWHEENKISYVCANLIAIKEGPRQGGLLLI